MKVDLYTKFLLTVIAAAFVLSVTKESSRTAHAQSQFKCTGKIKANAWGGIEPSIGGYAIEVSCSD